MCEFTCLDCKNYIPSTTKIVSRDVIKTPIGVISSPVWGDIPAHCDKHPRYFKKWWKENAKKKREDAEQPKCLELRESLKSLTEMIDIAKDILAKLDEKEKNIV